MATARTRASSKPPAKLRGQRQPMAISLPPDLVTEIDAVAAAEARSRAKLVEVVMRNFVRGYPAK